ncbi:murein DD-endopeptidase MepM/ murein hydrolase activator NlpD [Peribacillus deserti]|uniref:Murein DD-endopeptidase MepM/ murein hydrolase activator NlpD n=1 Tax=Peribacillus deserti TaxID=673318 RepID=A0ABS2QKQ9_9BACI|nr:M23 family metallopeptidase [Peribacillus deserti]MBM7693550.1 murein DD-endopeptidase MepM/ murein hydrolase activator NlpD [Peribacillus deserti]
MFILKKYISETLLKRAVFFTIILFFVSLHAAAAFGQILPTEYQVYYKGNHLGNVSDAKAVDKAITDKVKQAKKEYPSFSFAFHKEVSLRPETVLIPDTEDKKVIKQLKELPIEAKSYAIEVDGKKVVFLPEKKEAAETIEALKYQYLTDEEREAIEKGKTESKTKIKEISFSQEVGIEKSEVKPSQIMDSKKALEKLNKGSKEEKIYKVKQEEKLAAVASENGIDTKKLVALNPALEQKTKLEEGQSVIVEEEKPFVDVVINKEIIENRTIPSAKKVIPNSNLPKGKIHIKQEGKSGEKEIHTVVSIENGVEIKKNVKSQEIVSEPVATIVEKGTKIIPSHGTGSFEWPAVDGLITSKLGYRWGKLHKGIDIAGPSDPAIKASDNGVVIFAGMSNGYGNKVIIDHQNGFQTLYGHLDSISVKEGDIVPSGSKIGIMGSTGHSTGVHLHFEIRQNGKLKNPLNYIHR